MNTTLRNGIILIAAGLVVGVMGYALMRNNANVPTPISQIPEPTGTSTPQTTFDKTISDGTVTGGYNSARWSLATNKAQILATSYIPPCSDGFNYCLYYTGQEYKGTNFESAGLRITKRTDLKTERTCVQTPPEGFNASVQPTATYSKDVYASSIFSNVGDAGAGHMAVGSLYRLYVRGTSSCYEFETRVGQTQFANYPAGAIKEFTAADQAAVDAELQQLMKNISLPSGVKNLFS